MKVRIRALAMGALVLGGVLITSPVGSSSQSNYSLASLRHMLITRADLPTGWLPGLALNPTDASCASTPVLSRQHLLGTNSVGTTFSIPGGRDLAVE
jgi:hypothetical protein